MTRRYWCYRQQLWHDQTIHCPHKYHRTAPELIAFLCSPLRDRYQQVRPAQIDPTEPRPHDIDKLYALNDALTARLESLTNERSYTTRYSNYSSSYRDKAQPTDAPTRRGGFSV